MVTVTIEEAQVRLPELIDRLHPGEEVVITRNHKPIARLTAAPSTPARRQFGALKGTVLHLAADFDAPLEEFKEYMR